jgi:uncharacterized protein YecE (DUF72 family)
MKFGKLENVDGVDFTMPKDPKRTTELLASLPALKGKPKVYFGCTGWSMKEWVGDYYPKGTKTANYLDEYAKQFNTIELNTTHYRIPKADLIERWVEKTPKNFRFSPKIPQSISHSNELGLNNGYIEMFAEVIQLMGERLGVSFMQLPPSFGPQKLPILEQFFQRFPLKQVPLALEVRHDDWLKDKTAAKELWDLAQQYKVSTVMSDVAGRRDALHMELTTPVAMIRFVGNDLHPTDYKRVDAWVERLKYWFDQGLETVYFFHHQPDNILAPDMTEYFVRQINAVCDLNLRVPEKYKDAQMSLF